MRGRAPGKGEIAPMLALSLRRAAPLLAFCSLAFAQTDHDAVVVTASRTEQRVRDAIPHTTVLTRKDIRDSQAADLPTLLRREAGIEVAQNGGLGGNASLFTRGGRSAQTLVLIDGVRVEDAGFGTTAIQHLMLDDIDRIEIARGNVSSLYGSGAIGGVVQVFTRSGSAPVTRSVCAYCARAPRSTTTTALPGRLRCRRRTRTSAWRSSTGTRSCSSAGKAASPRRRAPTTA